jgi:hypothetical protein
VMQFISLEMTATIGAVIWCALVFLITSFNIKKIAFKVFCKIPNSKPYTSAILPVVTVNIFFWSSISILYLAKIYMISEASKLYLGTNFLGIFLIGVMISSLYVVRILKCHLYFNWIISAIIIFSTHGFVRDYAYLDLQHNSLFVGYFYKKTIKLNINDVEKIITFTKLKQSPPRIAHHQINDVVLYLKDGGRWSTVSYITSENSTARGKFSEKLISLSNSIPKTHLTEINAKDVF